MNITVLTGAGISAESGIQTFRDSNGLWNNFDVEKVATFDGWKKDKELVLDFYNQRRKEILKCKPNSAHFNLVKLEEYGTVNIITQNIDDLHERAGSKNVLHLHGEILKSRSSLNSKLKYNCLEDINIGDKCEKGSQLRPDVVWFGEDVPNIYTANELAYDSDVLIIIGTSLQVYPAAGIMDFYKGNEKIIVIDKMIPKVNTNNLLKIEDIATVGTNKLLNLFKNGTIPKNK